MFFYMIVLFRSECLNIDLKSTKRPFSQSNIPNVQSEPRTERSRSHFLTHEVSEIIFGKRKIFFTSLVLPLTGFRSSRPLTSAFSSFPSPPHTAQLCSFSRIIPEGSKPSGALHLGLRCEIVSLWHFFLKPCSPPNYSQPQTIPHLQLYFFKKHFDCID